MSRAAMLQCRRILRLAGIPVDGGFAAPAAERR
jgi:hypothetical protein